MANRPACHLHLRLLAADEACESCGRPAKEHRNHWSFPKLEEAVQTTPEQRHQLNLCGMQFFNDLSAYYREERLIDAAYDTHVEAVEELQESKDTAYRERNQLVAFIARLVVESGGVAGVGEHGEDPDWDPEWRTIVYVNLPTGQASWHFHDRDRSLVRALKPYPYLWDGHDTAEKYRRVERCEYISHPRVQTLQRDEFGNSMELLYLPAAEDFPPSLAERIKDYWEWWEDATPHAPAPEDWPEIMEAMYKWLLTKEKKMEDKKNDEQEVLERCDSCEQPIEPVAHEDDENPVCKDCDAEVGSLVHETECDVLLHELTPRAAAFHEVGKLLGMHFDSSNGIEEAVLSHVRILKTMLDDVMNVLQVHNLSLNNPAATITNVLNELRTLSGEGAAIFNAIDKVAKLLEVERTEPLILEAITKLQKAVNTSYNDAIDASLKAIHKLPSGPDRQVSGYDAVFAVLGLKRD